MCSIVELAFGAPAGLVPDIGGPQTYTLKELVRSYLRASGKHRVTMPIRLPGKAAGAYRAGANLAPDRAVGHRTWEEFLATRLADLAYPSSGSTRAAETRWEAAMTLAIEYALLTDRRSSG
jgi:uncharacterized protein YbjT (DUF2867 family)